MQAMKLFAFTLVAVAALQAKVQLPSPSATAIHYAHFNAQYGGATDEKFIVERVDPIRLTFEKELLFRDLLSDSHPITAPLQLQLIRLVACFDESERLVADNNGRWVKIENGKHAATVFELSAPAMLQLDSLLSREDPAIQGGERDKAPQPDFVPRRYHASGNFGIVKGLESLKSIRSRRVWPIWAHEPLCKAASPGRDEATIIRLLQVLRPSNESLDDTKIWFVAKTDEKTLIECDAHGRIRLSGPSRASRTYDLTASNFMELDSLATQLRAKAGK